MIEGMLTGGLADSCVFVPRWRLIWLELRQNQFWLRDPGSCENGFVLMRDDATDSRMMASGAGERLYRTRVRDPRIGRVLDGQSNHSNRSVAATAIDA